MVLTTFSTGDEARLHGNSIVIRFGGKRSVLSTAAVCGGYRDDLEAVFNNDITGGEGAEFWIKLRAPAYEGHMALVAMDLGLDPARAAGLSTAAQMENAAVSCESHGGVTVTAIVTAGIDVNGGRAGDPASWDELAESGHKNAAGTVNIILYIDAGLTPGALAGALITATEAKTAAIQELMAPSRYSPGLATGSGTDGAIIIADAESKIVLTDAGKHSKLGEQIGKAVKAAVKEGLYLQTGLSPESQRDVFRRVGRFGITPDSLWEKYKKAGGSLPEVSFCEYAELLAKNGSMLTYVSLYCHLLDQMMWGLIPLEESSKTVEEMVDELEDALLKILSAQISAAD